MAIARSSRGSRWSRRRKVWRAGWGPGWLVISLGCICHHGSCCSVLSAACDKAGLQYGCFPGHPFREGH
eukprot:11219735-Lingulodinium_polyedra.AAC.1